MKTNLKLFFLIILAVFLFACDSNEESYVSEEALLAELNALEDVSVTEITPETGFAREFAIDLTLPVDHNNPNGQTFVQRMYLSHTDVKKPMILFLSGYEGSSKAVIELCDIIGANQLTIPHRGYLESEIEPMAWEHLTIEQAAADNHKIVQLLKKIYKNAWISTGVSKGGMTALFLEYLYPDDADVVFAYVAPMVSGYPDKRITDFVKTKGGAAVQAEIQKFQRKLLENRDSSLYYFNEYAEERNLTYNYSGFETAFELGVLEYAVYIWQTANGYPYYYESDGLSIKEVFNRWAKIAYPDLYSDDHQLDEELFYYQAFTEFGYYDLYAEPFSDLLKKVDKDGLKLLLPEGVSISSDYGKMDRITDWLESEGERIIYLYGENDPWTAAQVVPSSGLDVLHIVSKDAAHWAKIKYCFDDEKKLIYDKLEEWLGITVNRL